jgi:HEAT repeat protein
VRASALEALARLGALGEQDLEQGLADPDPIVRRRAATLAATLPGHCQEGLSRVLLDPDPGVAEAVAWAQGERRESQAVPDLSLMAARHPDPLCREAAVAALGSIGDPGGLEAILAALSDQPPVRRRAVLALAPFNGLEVEAALRRALEDRDWQVRQAAEDLLGPDASPPSTPPC